MAQHIFQKLIATQQASRTLYCGGYDPHPFPQNAREWQANMDIYGFRHGGQINMSSEAFQIYKLTAEIQDVPGQEQDKFAGLMAAMEDYLFYHLELAVSLNIRVFKPQFGLYIQFGAAGMVLLRRFRKKIAELEKKYQRRLIAILDCKPGDIATTQAGYMTGYMGSLQNSWGINYRPLNYEIINPTIWMGQDVLVLGDKEKPSLGLELLREGKGLIAVCKTSNPSGPEYQDLLVRTERNEEMALYLLAARRIYALSQEYELEADGVSQLGLVIGATYPCDGSIRAQFPTYTGLFPGFGAQSKDKDHLAPFKMVFRELRRDKFNGFGGICASSRNHLFCWQKQYGGSGNVWTLETDLKKMISRHRELEERAFNLPEVRDIGIVYPF